jgi:hypothetical protein
MTCNTAGRKQSHEPPEFKKLISKLNVASDLTLDYSEIKIVRSRTWWFRELDQQTPFVSAELVQAV